jgi:hypothetical protein
VGASDGRTYNANLPLVAGHQDTDLLLMLHLNETAGNTLFYDSSPWGNHACCHRDVCPAAAERGLEFDGRGTYMMSPVSIQGLSAFTVAGWFYARSYEHAGKYPIVFMAPGPDCGRASLGFGGGYTTGPELYVSDSDDCAPQLVVSSPQLLALNQWHHVAAVFDSDTDRHVIYVNGELVAENAHAMGPVPNTAPGHPMWIGVNLSPHPEHQRWWDGYIDEVAVYRRALSAPEVRALYQGSASAD